jgi:hypothetical protein
MSTADTYVCVGIYESETVTLTMTVEQLRIVQTIMDIARQDECDEGDTARAECANLAEDVYNEITRELADAETLA